MKRAVITGLLAVGAACLILGCGKKEDNTQKADEPKTEQSEDKEDEEEPVETEEEKKEDEQKADEAEAEEVTYQVIGTESADASRLLLTNHTGEAITGFTVKASTEAEFPANMMEADKKIGNDETVCLYYAPPETDAAESSSGKMLRTTYEFSISNEGGREIRMPGLLFDDMEAAELCFEDEVGFVRYVSVNTGEEITTKEMTLMMQAQ